MNPKDIIPRDKDGLLHGYCEVYYNRTGELMCKGVYVNGNRYGYVEDYYDDGTIDESRIGYFIGHKKISIRNKEAYCYIWNKEEINE